MHRLLLVLTIANCAVAAKLNVIYQWKYIDYVWNSKEHRQWAIAEGRYDYTKIFTIDVQKAPDQRVFVTTPAFNDHGVPATLSTISSRQGPGGPLLKPYPNWSWHIPGNCNGITSVWRVAVDECDRLWVLDSGKIGSNQVCPAQLLVFDSRTDILQQRITIPNYLSRDPTNQTLGLLITPVVETEDIYCRRAWVYIADVDGGGLIIWDGSWIWRLDDEVFKADPTASTYTIAGENFTVADGIFGLAVSPRNSRHPRRLFFKPLASLKEYSYAVDDLHRLGSRFKSVKYVASNYQLPSQATAQAFSREGILFFGLTKEIAIACWNMNDPMDDEHVVIVAQNNDTLQFASGIKVTKRRHDVLKEDLWVSTNRFQKIFTGTLNYSEINFRILSAPIKVLVKDSECQLPRFRSYSYRAKTINGSEDGFNYEQYWLPISRPQKFVLSIINFEEVKSSKMQLLSRQKFHCKFPNTLKTLKLTSKSTAEPRYGEKFRATDIESPGISHLMSYVPPLLKLLYCKKTIAATMYAVTLAANFIPFLGALLHATKKGRDHQPVKLLKRLEKLEKRLRKHKRHRHHRHSRNDRYEDASLHSSRRERSRSTSHRVGSKSPTPRELDVVPIQNDLPTVTQPQIIPSEQPSAPGIETQPLCENILKILGNKASEKKIMSKEVHPDIACRWEMILTKRVSPDSKSELNTKYTTPSNCTLMEAPVLNPEVKAAMLPNTIQREVRLAVIQNQMEDGAENIITLFPFGASDVSGGVQMVVMQIGDSALFITLSNIESNPQALWSEMKVGRFYALSDSSQKRRDDLDNNSIRLHIHNEFTLRYSPLDAVLIEIVRWSSQIVPCVPIQCQIPRRKISQCPPRTAQRHVLHIFFMIEFGKKLRRTERQNFERTSTQKPSFQNSLHRYHALRVHKISAHLMIHNKRLTNLPTSLWYRCVSKTRSCTFHFPTLNETGTQIRSLRNSGGGDKEIRPMITNSESLSESRKPKCRLQVTPLPPLISEGTFFQPASLTMRKHPLEYTGFQVSDRTIPHTDTSCVQILKIDRSIIFTSSILNEESGRFCDRTLSHREYWIFEEKFPHSITQKIHSFLPTNASRNQTHQNLNGATPTKKSTNRKMTIPSRSFRILTIVLSCVGSFLAAELKTIHEWKYIEYASEDSLVNQTFKVAEEYNYTKIIPLDFQKTSDNRVLVTTPRLTHTAPSLSIVSAQNGDGGPLLEPYPSWDWHKTGSCGDEIITSVSRLHTDICDRLWLVDSGKIGNEQVCSARLFAFNTTTDQVIHRVDIPNELTHNSVNSSKGRLEMQIVETKGDSCEETWVYIADPEGYGLIIWDGSDMWRLENDDVYAPDSSATTFSVAGENVTLELGTSILKILPPGFVDEDYLFVRPLSSYSVHAVSIQSLHNSKNSSVTYYKGSITMPSQELFSLFSKYGVLMGAFTSSLAVFCWNLANPLSTEYVATVIENDEALQFTSAAKIFEGNEPGFESEEYWMMTDRYQKFALGTMDFDDINFRILSLNIAEAINGTVCMPSSHNMTSIEDKILID
ncbi:uncharacterized protein LOC124405958 [Diprion similis]|uniref:uncharacterized protein LOC124405958 n=1 Tax=Diprion similis TaxID=362088 RepID=UPI001EF8832D|nr:uncharacterized protein LOC124405958 [Diprion similis]